MNRKLNISILKEKRGTSKEEKTIPRENDETLSECVAAFHFY